MKENGGSKHRAGKGTHTENFMSKRSRRRLQEATSLVPRKESLQTTTQRSRAGRREVYRRTHREVRAGRRTMEAGMEEEKAFLLSCRDWRRRSRLRARGMGPLRALPESARAVS